MKTSKTLPDVHTRVREELERCVHFWLAHGLDEAHGGLYTCLDEEGDVYSTDKSVWMQGRAGWTFSRLCRQYGERPEWRAAAKSCLDFADAHCVNRALGNRMYFTVTEDGRPLRQRRYSFSEAFYAMGNAEYYALTGERAYLERARDAYELIWKLNQGLMDDPTGLGPKTLAETRRGHSLANPMIYLNLSMVLAECDHTRAAQYLERAGQSAGDILLRHHKPDLKATLETVGDDGTFWGHISAGRVVNPGHDMECAWFLLAYAQKTGDAALARAAADMFDFAWDSGWDEEYGGILYYTDALGKPPEAYEHDMKLWWPHNELLIASLMLYLHTRQARYLDIFRKGWDYALDAFSDPEGGEWFGYLRRDGQPTRPAAKGSTFKGPFHLPRMLMMLDQLLGEL